MEGQLTVLQRKQEFLKGMGSREFKYQDSPGEIAWLINSRPEKNNAHTYCWVSEREEFFGVGVGDWPRFEDKREVTV